MRRGITLLEVLFTIFVLTVGLLGLAALLTGGSSHFSTAEQTDRSASVGKAAQREIEVRGMLSYRNWILPNGNRFRNGADRSRLQPFVVDPLFVATNGTATLGFPFDATVNPALRVQRITLAGFYNQANLPASLSAAERVFRGQEDLGFSSASRDARPQQMSTGGMAEFDGNYSWVAFVTPSESENPIPDQPPHSMSVSTENRRHFSVAVVVFHKRVLDMASSPPSERQLTGQQLGGNSIRVQATAEAFQGLAIGKWVMLSGVLRPPADDQNLARPLHRWMRIVSLAQTDNPNERMIALAGPDWPWAETTTPANVVVTVAEDVVGVFERSVEMDVNSLLSP